MNNNKYHLRGKSVKTFHLSDGTIKIIWKHPKDHIIQRIIGYIAIIYWLNSWFSTKYNVFVFSIIIETIQSLMSFSFNNWFDLFIFLYSFLLGLFVMAFCIFTFLIWIAPILLSIAYLLNLILPSGSSELILNHYKFIYVIGREPNYFQEKRPVTDQSKNIKFGYREIKSFILSLWKKMIIGKSSTIYSKNNIQGIKLENTEEQIFIILSLNNEEVIIGKYLDKSDKQWLYQILKKWLNDDI